jgi:uncharacterized protein (DUF1800 family)
VADVAATYRRTSGQIAPMVRQILTAPELLSAPPIFKRPFDYAVSALRGMNADSDCGAGVQGQLETMGQALFAWPMPNGYPTDARSWIGGLIPRWNFASDLVYGRIANTSVDLGAIDRAASRAGVGFREAAVELALGGRPGDPALASSRWARATGTDAVRDHHEYASLLLMSPEFQWR